MKVLFLDIDGVVNSREMLLKEEKLYGIPKTLGIYQELADLVIDIVKQTGAKIVLSSYWRGTERLEQQIVNTIGTFYDRTPYLGTIRGKEIQAWLDNHAGIEAYAILDDDSDMLDSQKDNFFQTTFEKGITREIADNIIKHLNKEENEIRTTK